MHLLHTHLFLFVQASVQLPVLCKALHSTWTLLKNSEANVIQDDIIFRAARHNRVAKRVRHAVVVRFSGCNTYEAQQLQLHSLHESAVHKRVFIHVMNLLFIKGGSSMTGKVGVEKGSISRGDRLRGSHHTAQVDFERC